MLILYMLLKLITSVISVMVAIWLAYGIIRAYRTNRGYEPMRAPFFLLLLNVIWWQAKNWTFGFHLQNMSTSEMLWSAFASLWTIVCCHFGFVTIRDRERIS